MCKSPGQVSTDQGWRDNTCYAHTCPYTAGSSPPSPDLLLPGQLHPSRTLRASAYIFWLYPPIPSHTYILLALPPTYKNLITSLPDYCSSPGLSPRISVPLSALCSYPCRLKSHSNPNASSDLVTPAQNPGVTFCVARVKLKMAWKSLPTALNLWVETPFTGVA